MSGHVRTRRRRESSSISRVFLPGRPWQFACLAGSTERRADMRRDRDRHDNLRLTIDPATRVTPGSADGRVLLHLETGRMCAINAMGSRIWTKIEAGRSFEEIVDALAVEYEA